MEVCERSEMYVPIKKELCMYVLSDCQSRPENPKLSTEGWSWAHENFKINSYR